MRVPPTYAGIAGCERMARNLLDVHGLAGWTFKWDNARTRLGACDHKRRVISLSRPFAELWGAAEMRDTVLHEIAHALAGSKHGHDSAWRAVCRRVGAVPERCAALDASLPLPPARYTGTCPNGHIHGRQRRPTAKTPPQSCGKCSRRFDSRYLITWQDS